jgi:hypothetical protein
VLPEDGSVFGVEVLVLAEGIPASGNFLGLCGTFQLALTELGTCLSVLFVLEPQQPDDFGDLTGVPSRVLAAVLLVVVSEEGKVVRPAYLSNCFELWRGFSFRLLVSLPLFQQF